MLSLVAFIEGLPDAGLLLFIGVALVVAGVVVRKVRGLYARATESKGQPITSSPEVVSTR